MNVNEIKGIGEKTEKLFNKLGVFQVSDLLTLYPRDYDVFRDAITISQIDNEAVAAVEVKLHSKPVLRASAKYKIVSALVTDVNGDKIQCVWYNMPFLAKTLLLDEVYIFRGRFRRDKVGKIIKLEHPDVYTVEKYSEKLSTMQPIYPLTHGLTNNMVIKAIKQVFSEGIDFSAYDYLTESLMDKFNLISYGRAMEHVHFPEDMDSVIKARKRLCFDEFLIFTLALRYMKEKTGDISNSYIIHTSPETEEFIDSLDFNLTSAQMKVLREINEDMESPTQMNRLIQGDVGSGKTIIAIIALLNTGFAGFQGALMAPTEVLAVQHYENISELIRKHNINLSVGLLTGSMTAADKREMYAMIEDGSVNIVIGTHALIQEKVKYKNLALVITDEQHRFGVNQRRTLQDKGYNPHIIVMSATPIPRTLAIILYGDLDISVIDELPSNRLPIKNCVVTMDYRPKAYDFISKQVKEGRQVYVICPMVEASESIEACDVISYAKNLKENLDPNINVEYLHGKMKGQIKNSIMDQFGKGEIDVLVSTTVIEVGVNVPNATVMMIENAERFGLAALHQLRGRVGRGKYQSYCIFVSGSKSKDKLERLDILNKSNDGFYIASCDLKLRGPGEMFGIRQSGDLVFKIGDIYGDSDMLKLAYEFARQLEDEKISLPEDKYNILQNKINRYISIASKTVNL